MISNEQKVAAFDGIMRLVGTHALGEWRGAFDPPGKPFPTLCIVRLDGHYFYYCGYYKGRWFRDSEEELNGVVCWKYDDAENIVKLLKF